MPFYAPLGNYNRLVSMELNCFHRVFPILLGALLSVQFAAIDRSIRQHWTGQLASFVHVHSTNFVAKTLYNRLNSADIAAFQRTNHSIRVSEPMTFHLKLRDCDAVDLDRLNHPVCMINPENGQY